MGYSITTSRGTSLTSLPIVQEVQEAKVDEDPSESLRRFVSGFWVSCALQVVTKLRVADYLTEIPLRSEELALLTETHSQSLYRLLRALSSVGVFAEDENKYFSLTTMGKLLISDGPRSLRSFVLEELDEAPGQTWEDLLWSVKTGRPARVAGRAFESRHISKRSKAMHPKNAERLGGVAALLRAAILRDYDFSSVKRIVDIGGGDGTFLAFLLQAHEPLVGVVFDYPWKVKETQLRLATEGVTKRCRVIVGNFLESVPSGHDMYVLRQIVHDYTDKEAVQILKNCQQAMLPHSRLLFIESVIPPGNTLSLTKLRDLKLMIFSNGHERTEAELCSLLRKAELRAVRLMPLDSEVCLIEAVRG